jgi:acyl-CoA thioester hydrolase
MERGRTNHLRLMGAEQQTLFEQAHDETPGFAFVVRSMQIDFLKPARMDDVLDVVTWPVAVKGASITLGQEVRRGDHLLVKAEVRVAFISEGRAQPIPKSLRAVMKADLDQLLADRKQPIDKAVCAAKFPAPVRDLREISCRARHCRRLPKRPPPRRPAWRKTPGIRAIPNASRWPIPKTVAGATARSFSRGGRR